MARCRSTLRYDDTWHTRCLRDAEPVHTRHVGNQRADHPRGEVVRWTEASRDAYQSDRPDSHAWEVPAP